MGDPAVVDDEHVAGIGDRDGLRGPVNGSGLCPLGSSRGGDPDLPTVSDADEPLMVRGCVQHEQQGCVRPEGERGRVVGADLEAIGGRGDDPARGVNREGDGDKCRTCRVPGGSLVGADLQLCAVRGEPVYGCLLYTSDAADDYSV